MKTPAQVFVGNFGGKPPSEPPAVLAQKNQTGFLLHTAPNQSELAKLAAAVSHGKSPAEAVAYAFELWRESATVLSRVWEQGGIYCYDISIAKSFADVFETQIKNLPQPKRYPATLDDFFRFIVKAKTPADCTKRMRDCLEERYKNMQTKPIGAFTLEGIKEGDKTGGFFTPDLWRVLGTSYILWWKAHKSKVARASARRRSRPS